MTRFIDLPLHDAIVREVQVNLTAATCRIVVDVFVTHLEPARPHRLEWSGVTFVNLPMMRPWGPSESINIVRMAGDEDHRIEMQSGDELRIVAKDCALIEMTAGPVDPSLRSG
jgi:hypothetical protein